MVSPIASPDKILPIASTNLPLPIASTDDLISMIESKKKSGLLNRTNVIIAAVGLIAIASATTFYLLHGSGNQVHYVTELSTMGRLIVTASASGTLQPTKSVDIGSELSGTLVSVLAQENEQVKKGQLLAELEPSKLVDAVSKSRAALAAADARVLLAQATVAEARAMHARMLDVSRLSAGKVPAKTEMETASATLQRAIANETSAKSDVMQAKAALKTDETNLSKAKITSPVNGVVLTRKVEPGNTVAATMTTPVLFVIAEDLSNMELQVKVDEADVANVKEAQPASFTVSAWPGRIFPAHIERVGLGSTITDNVVTYKTVLRVANIDLALRPGMTATATIVTAERDNVLLVPNTALRFTPAPLTDTSQAPGLLASLVPRLPPPPKKASQVGPAPEKEIWILVDGIPKAIPVKTGVSDGRQTEVTGGELKVNTPVIVDEEKPR